MQIRFEWVDQSERMTSNELRAWISRDVMIPFIPTTFGDHAGEAILQVLTFECESLGQLVSGNIFGSHTNYKIHEVVQMLQRRIGAYYRYDLYIDGKTLVEYAIQQESLAASRLSAIEVAISMIRNLPKYLWFRPVHEVRLFLQRAIGEK